MAWSSDDLERIDGADELEIATHRRDGTARRAVPIWVVRVAEQVYVRTWHRRDDGWFGHALDAGRARIRVPGLELDVAVEDVGGRDAELRAGVDAAYRAKYRRYGAATVDRMVNDDAAASTLRLTAMSFGELPVPTSAAAVAALEVTRAYSSPALVNHCLRAYLYAADLGLRTGVEFDVELLYVASMLHDLGLVEAFDAHRRDFETVGGDVAWVFAAGAGWPLERRDHVARVVVDHMRADVDPAADPEGHLLMRSTSMDISARRLDDWDARTVHDVLAAYPRLDLATEFVACFTDQAQRKPDSSAAASVASGIAGRMANHPHEQRR